MDPKKHLKKHFWHHKKKLIIIERTNDMTKEIIKPTRAEKAEWKEYLWNALYELSTERPEFYPRKRDSLATMLASFLSWAENYNEGYFPERDDADTDRYCAWLVQEYEARYGEYEA